MRIPRAVEKCSASVFSLGRHALAQAYRERGDDENAKLYYAMGQDLLSKATNTLAYLMALGIQQTGVVRH